MSKGIQKVFTSEYHLLPNSSSQNYFGNNMSMDYFWPLPDGFPPGSRVTIKGIPTLNSSEPYFGLNFVTKLPCDGKKDIAYHTRIHYGENYIASNSLLVGKGWQKEEVHRIKDVFAGKPFEIIVVCEVTHFSLYINGSHFSAFQHRVPFERIQGLTITGEVKVTSISMDRIKSFNWPLPNGFQLNETVTIRGAPGTQSNSDQFEIAFHSISPPDSPRDIPFSMTVRFNEGILVNNTCKFNAWGKKEIHENLPIQRGKDFVMMISNKATHFKVFVNEKEFCTYNLRVPYNAITHLIIQDNVYVSSITVSSAETDPRTNES